MPEIAITGLGVVAPNGTGKEEFWQALKNGVSGIGPVTRFDASGYPSRVAGEVKLPLPYFDEQLFERNNKLSLTSELIMTAGFLALQDAGLSRDAFANSSSGIWVGTTTTDMGLVERDYSSFKEQGKANPFFITSAYPHASARSLGAALQCLGPVTTASIGCSSGLFSIVFAAEAIARGDLEIALAGGGDAPVTPFLYSGFCEANFLSTSFNQAPHKSCRPFDASRDGGVLSEGVGMIVLEKAETAARSNRSVYGYLSGWNRSNAYKYELMEEAFFSSMTGAIKKALLYPHEVDYICANAPGDKYIDTAEVKAVARAFSRHAYNIPVSSIKSAIGNPLAAAGPLQLIASLQAMNENFVPPTINLDSPSAGNGMDFVANKGRMARLKNILVNAHEFGGSNISLLLRSANCIERRVW